MGHTKTKQVLGQPTTDAEWPRKRAHWGSCKNLSFCNHVIVDARGAQALYLLNCVCGLKHVTVLFVTFHAPLTNVQISVLTTLFYPSCVHHRLLLNVFTIINYRYIVIYRINIEWIIFFVIIKLMKLYHFFIVWSLNYFQEYIAFELRPRF